VAVTLPALSLLHHCVAVAVRALTVWKKIDYHKLIIITIVGDPGLRIRASLGLPLLLNNA
jgi:hypothetical protein